MFETPVEVLIVDDEEAFAEMLVESLKQIKTNASAAHSGKACIEKLEQDHMDVVILDIKMPGMDGIETLKAIKKKFPLVEVIMLTGHGAIGTAVEGMKLGAFDYVLKPADFDDLVEKVKAAGKRKDEHEERIRKAEARALLKESRKGGRKPFNL